MKKLGYILESLLWNTRFVVLTAVLASLVVSLLMFFVATLDVVHMVSSVIDYTWPGKVSESTKYSLRNDIITHLVESVDGYLLATVMLIFSLGLYELFISKIHLAKSEETSQNVLVINSLDDLKNRLLKVIMMILVVKFFELAISMKFKNPLDLLTLAGGICLIGLALYFSHASEKKH